MQSLDIKQMPLEGRHVIEASAGTGKTYSISELYIRLLLEKKLLPKNILVMTFTKDATQEIINRIESKIREKRLDYNINSSEHKHLNRALLEIDEAAIFTIHGFCKKILSEQAFASDIDIEMSMEADTSDLLLEATEEYFRKHINVDEENFNFLKLHNWHTPERFLENFKDVVKADTEIQATTLEEIEEQLYEQKLNIFDKILKHKDFIFRNLVDKHPKSLERELEWNNIESWCLDSKLSSPPKSLSNFINGSRYKKWKDEFELIFADFKTLKDEYKNSPLKNIEIYKQSFQAYSLAKQVCLNIRQDFKNLKSTAAVLDFDDLILKLRDALRNSQEVASILQKQYPVALIDEFQDTDSQQYEILDIIYPLKKSELLLVMIGDPKQAIYKFRGGDIYTYLRAKQSAKYIWTMSTNWRSTSQMVDAYNRLFYKNDILPNSHDYKKDIFSKDVGYQIVKPAHGFSDKSFDDNFGAINYFYYNNENKESKINELRAKLAKWTTNEIVRLLKNKKVSENDIAILVQKSDQAKMVSQELKEAGLSSVYLSERSNIYATDEASQIYTALHGINNYYNQKLLKQALATSFLGKTAEDFFDYKNSEISLKWQQAFQRAGELKQIWSTQGAMALIIELLHNDFVIRVSNKNRTLTNILHLAELIKVAENKYKSKDRLISWLEKQIFNQNSSNEAELRLESDDQLIKITTIHGSKGLEYPIVFIPFASDAKLKNNSFINKISSIEKIYHKVGKDQILSDIVKQQNLEESMRLLYVAVTRAVDRCYVGVANFKNPQESPLARFVDFDEIDGWQDKIQKITNNSNNYSRLIIFNEIKQAKYKSDNEVLNLENLTAKKFTQKIKKDWQLISFSSIATHVKHEQSLDIKINNIEDNINDSLEIRFRIAKGADTGNLLHNILELSDFSKPLDDNLIEEQVLTYKVLNKTDVIDFKEWINEIIQAYIPNLYKDNYLRLVDLSIDKTLREVEFYLPVANKSLFKKDIYRILAEHRNKKVLETTDGSQKLFGMLHGFIDLIFEHEERFYIVDYKSSHLGDKFRDYSQAAMKIKNQHNMYDLQYLIYSVALHRFLQQNLENYNFDKHFGGIYYLYLRGVRDGFGIYGTLLDKKIVLKLDSLFGN